MSEFVSQAGMQLMGRILPPFWGRDLEKNESSLPKEFENHTLEKIAVGGKKREEGENAKILGSRDKSTGKKENTQRRGEHDVATVREIANKPSPSLCRRKREKEARDLAVSPRCKKTGDKWGQGKKNWNSQNAGTKEETGNQREY